MGVPPAGWQPARRAGTPGLRGSREDLRSALLTVLTLALSGLAAGGLWIWFAPRADYRVTATGVEPVGKVPSPELFMADDGVFVLVLAGLGLLAGVAVWLQRRRRGALTLVALATGMLAAGVVAWQLGELAGPGPTKAELADVGTTVTTGLSLGATAALAVGPFAAVLVYLVATALTARDDLGRGDPAPEAAPLRPPLPPVPPPISRG
jgi:LPXTG-motif cell wall-anchored protein